MTREEAMARYMLAKKNKQEMISKLEVIMKDSYESRTGKKATYFFAM